MEAAGANATISTLRSTDDLLPFKNRQGFLKYVAAFVTVYNQECLKEVFGKKDHPVLISILKSM